MYIQKTKNEKPCKTETVLVENGRAELSSVTFSLIRGGDELREKYPKYQLINAEMIKGPLLFRSRREGDRFTSVKRKNTKSLKKLFNEMKIPPNERDGIPILCDGDNIVWIYKIGTNAPYSVTDKTKELMVIID